MTASTFRPLTAWIPIAMSLAALGAVVFHLALYGPAPQPDEGAAAHIWQLLMAGQAPILIAHAVLWLRRAPKAALQVMAVQLCAVAAAVAPIYILRW